MNRVDFGKLVASLRKEHENEDGASWTQEKLAQETNLAAGAPIFSRDIICSIELGKRNLEGRMLVALATALQLTSDERKEFFLAASGVDTSEIACQENDPRKVYSQVIEIIKELCVPAMLLDSYCNILAVNDILLNLADFPQPIIVQGAKYEPAHSPNLLRFIFSEDVSTYLLKLMGEEFPNCACAAINAFRTFSLAHRATPYFQDLLHDLRKSRLFKQYWSEIYFREKACRFNSIKIDISSSKVGYLSLFVTFQTMLTTDGELHLFVFTPRVRDDTNALTQALEHSKTVFHLTSWPNSDLK